MTSQHCTDIRRKWSKWIMTDTICQSAYYHTKIKDWPEGERPREKLLNHGPESLSDAELLAIFIGSGTRNVTALDLAKRMLIDHGEIKGLSSKNAMEISKMKGIGKARSARILAAFEVGRRLNQNDFGAKDKITCPEDIFRYYAPRLQHMEKEIFTLLLLNGNNRIKQEIQLTIGTLTASLVHPREVFKSAIDCLAAGIILMHNHPSGEPEPSSEDKNVTKQLLEASRIIGIPILDHIIIADQKYYSFADNGLIN